MPSQIYNVRQAAKILGLSTNTTYKYLNEGRIKAARGHLRGTFIITKKSLEDFLGEKLPENPLPADYKDLEKDQKSISAELTETVIEVTPPTLAIRVIRILIGLALISIIADTIFSKNFDLTSQIARVFVVTLFVVIAYQHGGFAKK